MKFILDLRALIAHAFSGDPDHRYATRFFDTAERDNYSLHLNTALLLEAEAVWLAGKVRVSQAEWLNFLLELAYSPAFSWIHLTPEIYKTHLRIYTRFGGSYTYFDSFHAASAKVTGIPLVTTDPQLLRDPKVPSKDLRKF